MFLEHLLCARPSHVLSAPHMYLMKVVSLGYQKETLESCLEGASLDLSEQHWRYSGTLGTSASVSKADCSQILVHMVI